MRLGTWFWNKSDKKKMISTCLRSFVDFCHFFVYFYSSHSPRSAPERCKVKKNVSDFRNTNFLQPFKNIFVWKKQANNVNQFYFTECHRSSARTLSSVIFKTCTENWLLIDIKQYKYQIFYVIKSQNQQQTAPICTIDTDMNRYVQCALLTAHCPSRISQIEPAVFRTQNP